MSLKYEPSSEPLHISDTVLGWQILQMAVGSAVTVTSAIEHRRGGDAACKVLFFFFFTLVTGPRRSLSLKLSDTRVYEP